MGAMQPTGGSFFGFRIGMPAAKARALAKKYHAANTAASPDKLVAMLGGIRVLLNLHVVDDKLRSLNGRLVIKDGKRTLKSLPQLGALVSYLGAPKSCAPSGQSDANLGKGERCHWDKPTVRADFSKFINWPPGRSRAMAVFKFSLTRKGP